MADGREPRLFSTRSLYQLCVSAVVDRFRTYKPYLIDLPKSVRFDLYYQVKGTSSCAVVGTVATVTGEGEVPSIESPACYDNHACFCVSPRRETGTVHCSPRVPDNGDARSPVLASIVPRIRCPRRDRFDAFSVVSPRLIDRTCLSTSIDIAAYA